MPSHRPSTLRLVLCFHSMQRFSTLDRSHTKHCQVSRKGFTTLNFKLDSVSYGFGLTLSIFALSGNIVQVLKYYDDVRVLQKKEKEQPFS